MRYIGRSRRLAEGLTFLHEDSVMAASAERVTGATPQSHYSNLDRMLIGDSWRHGRSNRRVRDIDPYKGDTLLELAAANEQDLNEAYAAAAAAQPRWAARLPAERAAVMERAAQIMIERQEEIVSWLIHEAGSTRLKAQIEWNTSRAVMLEAARVAYNTQSRILPSDVPGKECRVYRKPVGVVGIISPWNWPLHLTLRSLAPALAAGNAVVVKPASDTPVTGGLLVAKILEEAGLPSGVLSVIVAAGEAIGTLFVAHQTPRVISFTGSTSVGRHVAELAARATILKRVDLELGGNCPFLVLEDAPLEQALDAAVFGRFLHQGQICMSANRFIVDRTLYDEFTQRFADRVRAVKWGNPEDDDTLIGPIINQHQLDHLLRRIDEARHAGARELVSGQPERLVLPPHVFADVRNDMTVAREELFGPVAPIIRASDEDDALRTANDTEQGLSACVFTGDLERGARFAQKLQSGMAHVNDQPVNDLPNCPFGGEKNSGIGRFGGEWAIEAFTTDQWVTVQHEPRVFPMRASEVSGRVSAGG
jgi:aldehyde dehydrogenase (NAD+)